MCRKSILLISFVLLLSLAGNVANADLVAGYGFEGNLDDASGNGYDGTASGTVSYSSDVAPGKSGQSLQLDEGEYVEIPLGSANPILGDDDGFTCVAWVNADAGMDNIIIASGGGEQDNDWFYAVPDGEFIWTDLWYVNGWDGGELTPGQWHHVAIAYDGGDDNTYRVYLDGDLVDTLAGFGDPMGTVDRSDFVVRIGGADNDDEPGVGGLYAGLLDDVGLYNTALTEEEIEEIMDSGIGEIESGPASNPSPDDEEEDVPLDTVLSWTPGPFADKHDVYFGTNSDDVNDATRTVDPNNVYKARQDVTGYPVFGTLDLDYGKTYYWRIDEANAPPDPTIYKGSVWSFTVEPFAYPIDVNNITATASSYEEGSEPNNTINGSGLDADDQHSIVETDMWLSEDGGPQPTWIQYEFDKAYNLHQMWIWNHNTFFEPYLGFGSRDVKIEYSTNGTNWTQLDGVPEFDQAPGKSNYEHSTTIDFNGVVAQYVKLTVNSSYSPLGSEIYGLSEVRLLYVPLRATRPNPDDEQEAVAPDVVLSWKAGREAATHEVYIGTDEQAVTDGTIAPVTSTEATYGPVSLDLDKIYYWKVAEVNNAEDPNVWESDVWSFTTNDFLVVDDMESYGLAAIIGQPGSNIWYTWKDGEGWTAPEPSYGGNGSGSASDLSTDPAIDGRSLACYYDNDGTNSLGTSGKKYYSEFTAAIADLPIGADWTQAAAKSLSLQFYGDPDNDAGLTEQMYIKINGAKIPYAGDMSDITEEWWHVWLIDLASFGISMQNITHISIGFGNESNTTTPGGSGVVYFDNARLYSTRCVAEYGPAGDITGDCIVDNEDFAVLAKDLHMPSLAVEYRFDTGLFDTSGNNRHGIAQNSPVVSGGVLALDGTNFVDIPLGADNPLDGSQDFSIAMDFQTKDTSILISSARDDVEDNHSMSVYMRRWDEPFQSGVIYDNFFVTEAVADDDPLDGEWHTMVVTYDADGGWNDELDQPTGWATVYLDGIMGEGVDMDPNIPDISADTVRIGGSLNTTFPYEQGDDTSVENLNGSIDNLRIYNFVLSPEDVRDFPTVPFGPADLNMDGIVDFRDFAVLAGTWLDEELWP